jgi:predicted transcriptional regulator
MSTTTSNVGDKPMETLIIETATDEDINARILQAADRGEPQPPGYFFDSEETPLDTLSGNRFAILKALTGTGPLGVRELA